MHLKIVALGCIILFAILGSANAKCDEGELRVRFGTVTNVDFAGRIRNANLLKDAINREMQGKACMEVLRDDAAFKGTNAIAALQKGDVDLVAPQFSTLGDYVSGYRVFDVPFAFRDVFAVERFQAAAGPLLANELKSNGIRSLGFWHERFLQMSGKVPLVLPNNAAGLKFRTNNSIPARDLIANLNAVSRTVAENDLLIALKKGEVEAQITSWDQLAEDQTLTAQAGVTETNHGFVGYQLMTTNTWWEKLDPTIAKPLSEIITRIGRQGNFETVRRETNSKRRVIRSGAPVRALTWQQRGEWRKAVAPIWQRFSNQRLIDLVNVADRAL